MFALPFTLFIFIQIPPYSQTETTVNSITSFRQSVHMEGADRLTDRAAH